MTESRQVNKQKFHAVYINKKTVMNAVKGTVTFLSEISLWGGEGTI
jgi:hypothetical protein